MINFLQGDCVEVMRTLPDESVQCCVTSPPYWGLRDYGVDGQIGLEKSPDEYVAKMVEVFREVWRVLRKDGTCWVNLGDSYNGYMANQRGTGLETKRQSARKYIEPGAGLRTAGLKQKDLVGIPWRVAFALQADGWYLRQDIIWHKPNPMPESVRDRCTKAHEYIFLLTKSAKYYYNADAIAEPLAYTSVKRLSQPSLDEQAGSDRVPGKTNGAMKAVYREPYTGQSTKDYASGNAQDASATKARIVDRILSGDIVTRNKRSVWTVTTKHYSEAHFATFPTDLIEPCIKAGSRPGDTVLDPFGGAGTTALVCSYLNRDCISIELNPAYVALQHDRLESKADMFTTPVAI